MPVAGNEAVRGEGAVSVVGEVAPHASPAHNDRARLGPLRAKPLKQSNIYGAVAGMRGSSLSSKLEAVSQRLK
ncbi:hypothetical protein RR48_00113 [Papilio machaon]|uniref:Uncharacterized protein n=1 Tax=Papilio machaon TaxID=76193 RepID=A0A0N0PFE0_PAPMA|nr:hypothetical protein RR48_00113 [Papilio machaon]